MALCSAEFQQMTAGAATSTFVPSFSGTHANVLNDFMQIELYTTPRNGTLALMHRQPSLNTCSLFSHIKLMCTPL